MKFRQTIKRYGGLFRLLRATRNMQKAVKRRQIAQQERIRVEQRYGHLETIPPHWFIYELLRSAYFQVRYGV